MPASCPECDNVLDFEDDEVEEGEVLTCEECGSDLEVVSIEPVELALVDGEDDLDDEDAYDEDDEDDDEDDEDEDEDE